MQTFLPYSDFVLTAKALDWKRLGKQRVEAMQILNTLDSIEKGITHVITKSGKLRKLGWVNHPAVTMWRGHEDALKFYMNVMIMEWIDRGYNNTMKMQWYDTDFKMPEWLGKPELHSSHRSNLLRKDLEFYSQYNWPEDATQGYLWLDHDGHWYRQISGTSQKVYLEN